MSDASRPDYVGPSMRPEDNNDLVHGSISTYTNHRCRCRQCKDANNKATKIARGRRAARLAEDPTLAPHGTESTYNNWLCRCELCSAAANTWRRKRRLSSRV